MIVKILYYRILKITWWMYWFNQNTKYYQKYCCRTCLKLAQEIYWFLNAIAWFDGWPLGASRKVMGGKLEMEYLFIYFIESLQLCLWIHSILMGHWQWRLIRKLITILDSFWTLFLISWVVFAPGSN